MVKKGIDQLVLGCTHYPLVKELIKKIVGNEVNIVDCNHAVALQTRRIMESNKLLNNDNTNPPEYNFFSSASDDYTIKKVLENKYEIFKFES